MASFSPKFCPIHLKIHVCDEMDVSKRLSNIESNLGAKVRRLHGIQTEEEKQAEAAKQEHQPGTFGAILAQAKANVAKQKQELKSTGDDQLEGKVVSESEVSDRMAALRAKMQGGTSTPTVASNTPTPSTGLGDIIQKARDHQADNPNAHFKVPERSKRGEAVSHTNNADISRLDALNEPNLDDLSTTVALEPIKKRTKKSISETPLEKKEKIDEGEITFSVAETKELIKDAVKEALEQVGLTSLANKKTPAKKTTKTSTTKSTNSKSSPKVASKTTSKKTSSTSTSATSKSKPKSSNQAGKAQKKST